MKYGMFFLLKVVIVINLESYVKSDLRVKGMHLKNLDLILRSII